VESAARPARGEHVFSGGIYRDVRLVATAALHVTWNGTFVTTPQVSKESGTVNVKTEIRNDSTAAKACVLKTAILDPDGKVVASLSSRQFGSRRNYRDLQSNDRPHRQTETVAPRPSGALPGGERGSRRRETG